MLLLLKFQKHMPESRNSNSYMAQSLDVTAFETIAPSRFISFTIPSQSLSSSHRFLRVAILDSPTQVVGSPVRVGVMFVPEQREFDWVFSTESGHLQLLLNLSEISRLILIGDEPINGANSPTVYQRTMKSHDRERLERSLTPLVTVLSPKVCSEHGNPEIPIVSYDDNVICSVVLEKCVGSFVGEMLVEDIEIQTDSEMGNCQNTREFRRRLRFKRMPNLVQTETKIVPEKGFGSASVDLGEIEFRPEVSVLVHPYLAPMVASLALISSYIEEQIQVGFRPKAFCVGVGGGALLSFLKSELGFEVVGVEVDQEVLRVARKYFGLEEDGDFLRVHVGDAIEYIEQLSCRARGRNLGSMGDGGESGYSSDANHHIDGGFDVILVDLDSNDVMNGISAPPLEFVSKDVLLAARKSLCRFGILVINVIPPNKSFYETLIHEFQNVFIELYEINVGNEENFVLIASVLPIDLSSRDRETSFVKKLRLVLPGEYMDSIRRI